MIVEIYDFYMKSGNVIRAAQNVSNNDKLVFVYDSNGISKMSYNFIDVPQEGVGTPNYIKLSQIESVIYIKTMDIDDAE